MKLIVERDALLRALTLAARVVARAATIPILSHVAIQTAGRRATLIATNLDRSIVVALPVVSATGAEAATTAPAAGLMAFARATAAGSQITIEQEEGGPLLLRAGRARASFPTLPIEDFPKIPRHDDAVAVRIAGAELAGAIERVRHAQSSEETRYYLNGIYLDPVASRLVATDGHRLAWSAVSLTRPDAGELAGIIIPRHAIADLAALAAEAGDDRVELEISPTSLRLEVDGVELQTKLVDGTFPDYQRVIPTENVCRFRVDRAELVASAARCTALTNDGNRGIRLHVADGTAQLTHKSPDGGEIDDAIDAQLETPPAETGFNGKYLAGTLDALDGDTVEIEFTPGGPILLRDPADRDGQLQVVMAMRI
jgi:DNA polymerase-3 subunit beta